MKNKISIIIPIYNGTKFINRIFDSILSQTYSNYEVIFINDGSTDESLNILNELKDKYSFIKVIDQKNKGRSESRNVGVENSIGEYLTFLDQDDYISNDFLEKLINNIKDNDILLSGFNRVDDKKIIKANIPSTCEWSYYKYCATWGKLYRSDFFKNNKLKFYEISGEDIYIFLNAISLTNKKSIINYAGYNNYVNDNSITHVVNKDKSKRSKIIFLLDKIEDSDWVNNLDQKLLLDFYLKTIVLYLFTQRKILNNKELYDEYKLYFDWLNNQCKKRNKKISFFKQKGEEKFVIYSINLFLIIRKLHLMKPFLLLFKKLGSNLMKN